MNTPPTPETLLTAREAYAAMFSFIEAYQRRGHSEDIHLMLHAMRISGIDDTSDPAMWGDWLAAVTTSRPD